MDMENGYNANAMASSLREQLKRTAHCFKFYIKFKCIRRGLFFFKILTHSLVNFNSRMTFIIVNPNFKKIMTYSKRLRAY